MRIRRLPVALLIVFSLVLLCATKAAAQPPARTSLVPGKLLIYYGWPSAIDGANGDVAAASRSFEPFDWIVLGDGLQDPKHGDHAKTKQIIATIGRSPRKVFGYVPIGRKGPNLSVEEIRRRVLAWKAIGARGVLLDEFGYDFDVTRQRQNDAVQAVHDAGLTVLANAWNPDDAWSSAVHPRGNPDGVATRLAARDAYLLESFVIMNGQWDVARRWLDKARQVQALQQRIPFSAVSVSTSDSDAPPDPAKLRSAWLAAAAFEHQAYGWSALNYGAGNSRSAPSTRPEVAKALGERFTGPPRITDGVLIRPMSNRQELWIDTGTRESGVRAMGQ